MNLHRIEGSPDWDAVAGSQRNRWQTAAARSGGILTPGNILTIVGLLLALYGLAELLKQHYWLGLAGLFVGRLCDLADGIAADSTGTKSPLGEAFDAGADKLITVLTVATLFSLHVTPWYVLGLVLLPHLGIGLLAIMASLQGQRLHPSRIGKIGMAAAWLGLGGLVLLKAIDNHGVNFLSLLTYGFLATSVALGFWALGEFVRRARGDD